MRLAALAPFIALTACKSPTTTAPGPADGAVPVAVVEPPPPLRIVDFCTLDATEDDPLCALLSDGRVACAHAIDTELAPPLAGVSDAVQLRCGEHSLCALEASGRVTCLARDGQLRRLDELGEVRTLARDCALTREGRVQCWNEAFELRSVELPIPTTDVQLFDLRDESLGCALDGAGTLRCWSNRRDPSDIPGLEGVTSVEWSGCFVRDGVRLCADEDGPPRAVDACDEGPCTCHFAGFGCSSAPSRLHEGVETLHEVVRRDGACALDVHGRLYCRYWSQLPGHEVALVPTDATSERLEPVSLRPPFEPLPDPATSDCPWATTVSNTVCERLTSAGLLACGPLDRQCARTCELDFTELPCEPDETSWNFGVMRARAFSGFSIVDANHVVFVQGTQVWLGPKVDDGSGLAFDAPSNTPLALPLRSEASDGSSDFIAEQELDSMMICTAVDGVPKCSRPIARAWKLDYVEVDEDSGRRVDVEVEYEAELSVSATELDVDVLRHDRMSRAVQGLADYFLHDTQRLKSGKYPLARLVELPFERLSE